MIPSTHCLGRVGLVCLILQVVTGKLKLKRRIDQRQHSPQGVAFINSPWSLLGSAVHLLHLSRLWKGYWVVSLGRCAFCILTTSSCMQRVARLREAGLKLSWKNCHLFKKEVVFLGHMDSEESVSTDPEKTKAVCEWPTPTSASALRSFLVSARTSTDLSIALLALWLPYTVSQKMVEPLCGQVNVTLHSYSSNKTCLGHWC